MTLPKEQISNNESQKKFPYKGATEGEMVGWHHRLNGHEFA